MATVTGQYARDMIAELTDAAARCDGDALVAALVRVRDDGHPELAERVTRHLIAIGMRRWADRIAAGEDIALPTVPDDWPSIH